MLLGNRIGEDVRRLAQLVPAHGVLEFGQGRLRRQRRPSKGIALDQQLVDRVDTRSEFENAVGWHELRETADAPANAVTT